MPYTKDNPPEKIKGLLEHAQTIWISAFNAAWKEYGGDEGKCNAVAWSAVEKAGYKKDKEGKWVKMQEPDEPNFDEVEIFEAGTYPQGSFGIGDLDEMVKNFDPQYHEPPVTIDHQVEGSAHGWIEKIWRNGTKLFAKIKQVSPWLKEQIKSGGYKKRSAEVWSDFEGTGKLVLKAVSFLGSMIPQVKGMKNILEYEDKHGWISIFGEPSSYAATDEEKSAQEARGKKYGISIVEGGHVTKPSEWSDVPDDQWGDPVNYSYPCPNADQTRAALKYWGMPRSKKQYSSEDQGKITERLGKFAKKYEIESEIIKHSEDDMGLTQEEVQKLIDGAVVKFKEETDAKIKKLTDENAELKKNQDTKFSEEAIKEKQKRIDAEVTALLKDGKITPAYVDAGFKQFLMAQPEDKKITFGEGAEKKEISVIDFAIDLFGNKIKGVPVHFGEIVKSREQPQKVATFKIMNEGEKIDADSLDLHEKTLAFMEAENAKGRKVQYREAVVEVYRQLQTA